jgi:Ni/Co efflux regulator RcnB
MKQKLIFTALAVLATTGVVVTTAQAQTNGMERRGERRDNRDEGREAKAECKAGDENSRPECRQDKRDTKQEGRGDDDKAPTDKPPGT